MEQGTGEKLSRATIQVEGDGAGASTPIPVSRFRPRRSITCAPETWAYIDARTPPGSFTGREVDVIVREAQGNNGRLRHAVAGKLNPIPFACAAILDATTHPEAVAAVALIGRCIQGAREELKALDGKTGF